MAAHTVLAVDLGGESGRVMAVHYVNSTLRLEELHRFPNTSIRVRGTLHWDFLRLWQDIQTGIAKGMALQPRSLGVDTWGVDFGLLDAAGDLIGNPVHYRDGRTDGMMERMFTRMSKAEIFAQTGIQFMPINTLFQLMSLVDRQAPQLANAHTFLTAPDLLNYWLTGTKVCEWSNATTTQLVNPRTGKWATAVLDALGLPSTLFPPIVPPGTRIGTYAGIPVIAPACHDTGSSVAAVPTRTSRYAYISSGTWSLVGLEVAAPVINAAALAANITNEGGVAGNFRLLKNVMGLWIIQQCRATWADQGYAYSYRELAQLAETAPSLRSFINPNDPCFLAAGDHPQRIQAWCADHRQPIPETHAALVRCVLESLALAYRAVLHTIQTLADHRSEVIHIVGGGCQHRLLCQMTADATGLPVVAGPVEATVLGNALVQLIALGELTDLAQARQLVAATSELDHYEPQQTALWDAAYERYTQAVTGA